MGFKCGIIGLPNVGKSTLFNVLTKAGVEVANFPFCTIQPNTGIVPVPDRRLIQLSKIIKPQRTVPTTMKFVDVAGLVKGASKGEGLGNQFLKNIRETEAICHVVRCFEDENILHFTGTVSPTRDIDIINTEMILSDIDVCEKAIRQIKKKTKEIDKKNIEFELILLEKCLNHLEHVGMLRTLLLDFNEKIAIRSFNFLTFKPTMYIANISANQLENNSYLDEVKIIAESEGSKVIPICATLESDISELKQKEHKEFMVEMDFKEPSINQLVCAGYSLLKLQTYFTVGIKEVRAWTIPIGSTALNAANKIHSDLKKGFIRAQIISFKDFIFYKSEKSAREAGKIRSEGKDYIVKDGDIIHFLFKV